MGTSFKYQSQAIENVQRRATKLLFKLKSMTHEERLRELYLPTLKYRRIRGDLIQAFKIINNIDVLDTQKFFAISNYTRTRNSNLKCTNVT